MRDNNRRAIASGVERQSVPTTDGLSCGMLEWISDDFSDKSGMLVPISLNQKRYWYQLDTGADEVVPYGSPEEAPFGFPMFAGRDALLLDSGVLDEGHVRSAASPRSSRYSWFRALIGRALVIDFPKRRVCLLERADLPESFTREADWSTARDTPRQTILWTLMSMAKSWTGFSTTRVPVPMRSALI